MHTSRHYCMRTIKMEKNERIPIKHTSYMKNCQEDKGWESSTKNLKKGRKLPPFQIKKLKGFINAIQENINMNNWF